MIERERLAQFEIAQDTEGAPIEVARIPGEIVCLAFDVGRGRLVELHLPKFADRLSDGLRLAFFARVLKAGEFRGDRGFAQVIDGGEDHGLVFYVTDVNNGETLASYTQRNGALRSSTATVLGLDLIEKLIDLLAYSEFAAGVRLGGTLLMADAAGQHYLRVVDFGLGMRDAPRARDRGEQSLVFEMATLLYQMLTGTPYEKAGRSTLEALPAVPDGLRYALAHALGESGGPCRMEDLRDALQEALPQEARSPSGVGRRHCAKLPAGREVRSPLDRSFCLDHGLPADLQERFRTEEDPFGSPNRYVHSLYDMDEGHRVSVQVLPPERIIDLAHYDAIPQSMWRQEEAKHPHILRAVGLWETPQAIVLAEERWPGLSLAHLLAHRGTVEPAEAATVLEHVLGGLDQAEECGLRIPSLHPKNIQITLGADASPRELKKLIDTRLGSWPEFVVKLRGHFAVDTFLEQPLHELLFPHGSYGEGRSHRDQVRLETLALAQALVGGRRYSVLTGGRDENVVAYVEEHLAQEAAEPGSVDLHRFVKGIARQARSHESAPSATREGSRRVDIGVPTRQTPVPSPFKLGGRWEPRPEPPGAPSVAPIVPPDGKPRVAPAAAAAAAQPLTARGEEETVLPLAVREAELPAFPRILSHGTVPRIPSTEEMRGGNEEAVPLDLPALKTARIREKALDRFLGAEGEPSPFVPETGGRREPAPVADVSERIPLGAAAPHEMGASGLGSQDLQTTTPENGSRDRWPLALAVVGACVALLFPLGQLRDWVKGKALESSGGAATSKGKPDGNGEGDGASISPPLSPDPLPIFEPVAFPLLGTPAAARPRDPVFEVSPSRLPSRAMPAPGALAPGGAKDGVGTEVESHKAPPIGPSVIYREALYPSREDG